MKIKEGNGRSGEIASEEIYLIPIKMHASKLKGEEKMQTANLQ